MKDINNILIPNVSRIPEQGKTEQLNKLKPGQNSDFGKMLENEIATKQPLEQGIGLSSHAAKRLHERNISIDGEEYMKIKDAMGKLRSKGGKDSLVITSKAAYIVDVRNNKIVTAIDKGSMNENVFTKIDSTVVMI